MNRTQQKKLDRLERLLAEASDVIRELKEEGAATEKPPRQNSDIFDATNMLAQIKALDRKTAENTLAQLKQHQLGSIFGASGGSPNDKSKPKNWLIEQILFRMFDFERGQDAIRENFDKKR
jgi:hypothetical protein